MQLYHKGLARQTRLISISRWPLLVPHQDRLKVENVCILSTCANKSGRSPLMYVKLNMAHSVLPHNDYGSHPLSQWYHRLIRFTEYLNWRGRLPCAPSQETLYS